MADWRIRGKECIDYTLRFKVNFDMQIVFVVLIEVKIKDLFSTYDLEEGKAHGAYKMLTSVFG